MPMSKKKTIYKPKKGKRISQKKLYKLPKQHGGDFMTDVKNFFTGGQDPTDGTPLDEDDSTKDDSAMNVEEKPTEDAADNSAMDEEKTTEDAADNSAMDEEKTTEDAADNSAMDEEKTTEDADDSKKEVDSEENSSNLATKASEVGALIGDSAKSVFNEGVSAVTQPSDEADESEPFAGQSDDDVEKSDDVDALKQENETLKQEISELKSKLIDKLEQENETLKQGTQQPENSFGEQPESSFGQEPSDNSFGEQEKPGSLDLTDSNDSESNVISSLDNSNENQESSDGSFSTINLDSENMTTMDDKSPDFELGSDISPIELKRTDSQTPTGGTKHKKKKQRRTRRKNHGKR
jgi:hypothetical protein